MSRELPSVDITDSPELLWLAEEVARTGEGRLLTRGGEPLATVRPARRSRRTRRTQPPEPDSLLNIIGIGASAEPTDIARYKHEYLAEAAEHRGT